MDVHGHSREACFEEVKSRKTRFGLVMKVTRFYDKFSLHSCISSTVGGPINRNVVASRHRRWPVIEFEGIDCSPT
jgi:hypothetical protein